MKKKYKSINSKLQRYIPIILEDESYLEEYILMIHMRYQFKANKHELHRTLELHCKDSYYNDEATLRERHRKLRGKYLHGNEDVKWIWVTANSIGQMAEAIVKRHALYNIICFDLILERYTKSSITDKNKTDNSYKELIGSYKDGDTIAEFVTPIWRCRKTSPVSGVILYRGSQIIMSVQNSIEEYDLCHY